MVRAGEPAFTTSGGVGFISNSSDENLQAKVVATWSLGDLAANFPMALDEDRKRLYVGCRSPARLLVLDTDTGKPVSVLEISKDVDDVFVDATVDDLPAERRLLWRGRVYRVAIPRDATLPAFLTVEGVAEPPEGELVLVLRRPPKLRDLLRRSALFEAAVRAREVYVSPDPTQIPQS